LGRPRLSRGGDFLGARLKGKRLSSRRELPLGKGPTAASGRSAMIIKGHGHAPLEKGALSPTRSVRTIREDRRCGRRRRRQDRHLDDGWQVTQGEGLPGRSKEGGSRERHGERKADSRETEEKCFRRKKFPGKEGGGRQRLMGVTAYMVQ